MYRYIHNSSVYGTDGIGYGPTVWNAMKAAARDRFSQQQLNDTEFAELNWYHVGTETVCRAARLMTANGEMIGTVEEMYS